MFIGFPHGKKDWRVYDLENGKIFVSRDVLFFEDVFPLIELQINDELEG